MPHLNFVKKKFLGHVSTFCTLKPFRKKRLKILKNVCYPTKAS